MSEQQEQSFSPHRVDESIDEIISTGQVENAHYKQAQVDPDKHLVHDLQRLYDPERKAYLQALQRVEDRLVEQHTLQNEHRFTLPPVASFPRRQLFDRWKFQQGRLDIMEEKQKRSSGPAKFGRTVSVLVAVLVVVGSLVIVLNYTRHHSTTTVGGALTVVIDKKATSTSTPSPNLGTIVYTAHSPNNDNFSSLVWSPDSKRVASATISGVEIWDATTGKNKISVQLAGTNEWTYGGLSWSPDSQLVAVATNQRVLLVNGQSGEIVRTYKSGTTAMTRPATTGASYFASQFPTSSGLGFRATSWSPDGRLIASALSLRAQGEVQVWDTQTGVLSFTLALGSSYNFGALSWSSDGQYIAASAWDTQRSGNISQPQDMIAAWSVATHQSVFQHKDFLSSDSPVLWLPQSHRITFGGETSSNDKLMPTIEIWDVLTGKSVKQYIGSGTGGLTLSPDGKYLAYAGYSETNANEPMAVIIKDITTDQQVYVYKSQYKQVGLIAWSPDGKYILSSEQGPAGGTPTATVPVGKTQWNTIVNVWVAE